MLGRLKEIVTRYRTITGIEVELLGNNQYNFTICVVKSKNGVVTIENKQANISSVEKIIEIADSKHPCVVVVNGRGVLHKELEGDLSELTPGQMLKRAIPNIEMDAFYMQAYFNTQKTFISLIRKDLLDQLLVVLQEKKLDVIDVELGAFIFRYLLDFTEINQEEVKLPSGVLQITRQDILSFQPAKEIPDKQPLKIGEDWLEIPYTLSYALALKNFITYNDDELVPIDKVREWRRTWRHKRIFHVLGITMLSFYFILLLVNFIFFNQFSQENNLLSTRVSANSSVIKEIDTLKKELKERTYFMENAGWLNATKNSFLADRIASTVPAEIKLLEMGISPLDEQTSKKDKKLIFIKDIIAVKGECRKPENLNNWLKELNKFEWIVEVKEQNYVYDNSKQAGSFDFQLLIDYKKIK